MTKKKNIESKIWYTKKKKEKEKEKSYYNYKIWII